MFHCYEILSAQSHYSECAKSYWLNVVLM